MVGGQRIIVMVSEKIILQDNAADDDDWIWSDECIERRGQVVAAF